MWETECENYSKRHSVVRSSEAKNRKQFKQHVSKGMSTKYIFNEMNACHMVPLGVCYPVCISVCACLRQIGVYLKPSQMTGLAPKANQLGKWVKAPLIPVNFTNQRNKIQVLGHGISGTKRWSLGPVMQSPIKIGLFLAITFLILALFKTFIL